MILLTGSAGFIGSHVAARLQEDCVPWLRNDPRDNPSATMEYALKCELSAVIHMGAISDTTCTDDNALYETNVRLPHWLAAYCYEAQIPFVYASSASVYGNGAGPLNQYAHSKLAFDNALTANPPTSPWYGLRLFNVYGSGEGHKGRQASVPWQMKHAGLRAVFEPFAQRDFIHVSDVVETIMWFLKALPASGIYDVGTGRPRTFMDVALICRGMDFDQVHMPASLKGRYQFQTKADLAKLRAAGYDRKLLTLEEGVKLV